MLFFYILYSYFCFILFFFFFFFFYFFFFFFFFFFFQAEDGIRDVAVTGVQTCALPISRRGSRRQWLPPRTPSAPGGTCRASRSPPRRCPGSGSSRPPRRTRRPRHTSFRCSSSHQS